MKHLVLIRHAESAEKVTGTSDEARELTLAGMHQAAMAGVFLFSKIHIDIIISSTAARAQLTSQVIAEQTGLTTDDILFEHDLYQASVGTLYNILRDTDAYQNVAIVGHNPTISYFSEYVTNSSVDEMKPGTVLILKLDIANWKELQKGSATFLDRFDAER